MQTNNTKCRVTQAGFVVPGTFSVSALCRLTQTTDNVNKFYDPFYFMKLC